MIFNAYNTPFVNSWFDIFCNEHNINTTDAQLIREHKSIDYRSAHEYEKDKSEKKSTIGISYSYTANGARQRRYGGPSSNANFIDIE